MYDALKATNGEVLVATNAQARRAAKLFEELEGVDIHPAAAVATASLIKAVQEGKVEKSATVMLNITGAGEQSFKAEHKVFELKPEKIFSLKASADEVIEAVEEMFKEYINE